jgi:outer membrane cobalamin receptor
MLLLASFCACAGLSVAQEPAADPAASPAPESRDANGNLIPATAQTPGPIAEIGEVDRIMVTGTNITTTSESPPFVPESIFNREAVERTGSRTLGDFFQALPQNSGASFTENQNESLSPGGASVALRGLGPDATLVLVNGRRVAPFPFAQAASRRSSIRLAPARPRSSRSDIWRRRVRRSTAPDADRRRCERALPAEI